MTDHPNETPFGEEPIETPAQEPAPAAAQESAATATGEQAGKPDIFDYLESQPDVADPFEPSQPESEPAPRTDAQLFADFVRMRSRCGLLTAKSEILKENPEMEAVLASLSEDEQFSDIRTEQGKKDLYYYSTPTMAVNYAHMAMLADEKDLPRTIADIVRWQCRIGPAPTPVSYFKAPPYCCTLPQIDRALMLMKRREEYADIEETTSYNGIRYLYSSKAISAKYAKALADYSEESAEIQ